MFVQISKEEYKKEISKKAWYQTNNIIWTIIFLYPVFSIVDYISAEQIWLQFFIIRIITVMIIYGLNAFFQSKNYNYRTLLHISFFLLSATSAILCNIVNIQQLNIYFLMYAAILLFLTCRFFGNLSILLSKHYYRCCYWPCFITS